ncbi:uncharacterized protein LOC134859573 [Eleginops maclovinus]|uniref:uncharacterized protein LOC134859573 n=1 Tax=Eleginops maclovinus TaxID=56733 RepID=UPI00308071F7
MPPSDPGTQSSSNAGRMQTTNVVSSVGKKTWVQLSSRRSGDPPRQAPPPPQQPPLPRQQQPPRQTPPPPQQPPPLRQLHPPQPLPPPPTSPHVVHLRLSEAADVSVGTDADVGYSAEVPSVQQQDAPLGIYPKVREVIDLDSRYYLVGGDYPRCSKCMIPVCPWSTDLLSQLDPAHRNRFPAVLTTQLALDRKCVTMLKPRTAGNSSSYLQQAMEEVHSEEWARRSIEYLSDCELHKKRSTMTQCEESVYQRPPPFCPLPLSQWFETVHGNEILGHLDEMKGVITSTYGRILKLDSTKKITKKLAGGIADTATWMTNVSNECGEVLNCVLTTGEGAGLEDLCQGIVKRYQDGGEPEPDVIYVDRGCCSETGAPPVLVWFRPWKTKVKLDIFHFMRRFTTGLTTEHHPLYGTFCSKLSSCIFEWDQDDIGNLKEAKRSELKKKHAGHAPSEAQVLASISSRELARHCRRRTRGVEESRSLIQGLLNSMWDLTDTSGLPLINPESMARVWEVQQKHLPCIQDPPGLELYTKLSGLVKGNKVLDVLRCGRGSSSVESFHRHQCTLSQS